MSATDLWKILFGDLSHLRLECLGVPKEVGEADRNQDEQKNPAGSVVRKGEHRLSPHSHLDSLRL